MPDRAYIGPEQRKGERRKLDPAYEQFRGGMPNRRIEERRQEAHAGVIANMSADDMLALKELWVKHKTRCQAAKPDTQMLCDLPAGHAGSHESFQLPGHRVWGMSYDEIIAREA